VLIRDITVQNKVIDHVPNMQILHENLQLRAPFISATRIDSSKLGPLFTASQLSWGFIG
jgi:hypothetical protein